MQPSFLELEYAAKKEVARYARFLVEIEAVTTLTKLVAVLELYYPEGRGRGRPLIKLSRRAAYVQCPAKL